jgi:hypothetical protein
MLKLPSTGVRESTRAGMNRWAFEGRVVSSVEKAIIEIHSSAPRHSHERRPVAAVMPCKFSGFAVVAIKPWT